MSGAQGTGFVHPDWLLEIEADAAVRPAGG